MAQMSMQQAGEDAVLPFPRTTYSQAGPTDAVVWPEKSATVEAVCCLLQSWAPIWSFGYNKQIRLTESSSEARNRDTDCMLHA